MPPTSDRPRKSLTLRRKIAFALILVVLLPLALLLTAEVVVRLVGPRVTDDPFLALTDPISILSRVEIDGAEYYRISNKEVYRAQNATFPVRKPDNALRIFCLGGSAAAGWPHAEAQSYPAYLKQMLVRALPDRQVEVQNLAGHGYASYRVRMIFDEVIDCSPDLIIVYSGNNEFIESRSYLAESKLGALVRAVAHRSQLVRLVRSWAQASLHPENTLPGNHTGQMALHLWSNLEQLAVDLRSDPAKFAQVQEHYAYSMNYIAREAAARGVPVLFLTVPVNLRDWHPHASSHTVEGDALAEWQRHYRAGRRKLLQNDPEAARQQLVEATRIDPGHADSYFYLGRANEKLGRAADALASYRAAKNNDQNPFRAHAVFNEVLRHLPAEHPNAHLLDTEELFVEASAPVAPGFDLFLDYVHPNKQGNLLLARQIFTALTQDGLGGALPAAAAPGRHRAVLAALPDDGYRDATDLKMQWMLLTLFAMTHQYEAFCPKADQLREHIDAGDVQLPADLIVLFRERFATFLAEQNKELLGQPFDPDYRAKHKQFYREFFLATQAKPKAAKN